MSARTAAELADAILGNAAPQPAVSASMPTLGPKVPMSGIDLIGRCVITMHGRAPLDDLQYEMIVSIAVEATRTLFQQRLADMSAALGITTHESIGQRVVEALRTMPVPPAAPPEGNGLPDEAALDEDEDE